MPIPRIDGIYELGHVLYALDAATHGFARGDIERVECYWTFSDLHSSSAGFIFRLRDGRRAWVELLHTHAFEQEEDLRIDVAYLAADAALPALNNPHAPVDAWSFETAHLNRAVER